MKNKMLITTTNSIDGKEIKEYLNIVSDRIVIGAGFLSEFFAGFTDVFGGRSGKFEERMHELHNYLMKSLETKAKKLKADAIIGLRIDMDEINGKNTQMFMISGVGTAVKFMHNDVNVEEDVMDDEEEILITSNEIKLKIFEEAAKNKLDQLDELYKNGLIESNRVAVLKDIEEIIADASSLEYSNIEFLIRLSKLVFAIENTAPDWFSPFVSYGTTYYYDTFSQVMFDLVENILQQGGQPSQNLWNEVLSNVHFKYSQVYKLLCGINSSYWGDYVLPLLNKSVSGYYKNDIEYIEKILTKLKEIIFREPIIETQRNGLKTMQVWKCYHCDTKISIEKEACWNCGYDKYGSKPNLKNDIEKVINYLQTIVDICNTKNLHYKN